MVVAAEQCHLWSFFVTIDHRHTKRPQVTEKDQKSYGSAATHAGGYERK